jgi:DNA-binding HxlR family transcriptional regulator
MTSIYGQYCPVARAAEVLAERWTPLVVRELLCGSRRFSELQRGLPSVSKSVLMQRLRSLERNGVVESRPQARGRGREFCLTPAGEDLAPIIELFGRWGHRWVRKPVTRGELDAGLLLWDMARSTKRSSLPQRRTVVRVDLTGVPREPRKRATYWILLDRGDSHMCFDPPAPQADLELEADLAALTDYWLGHTTLAREIVAGRIRLRGPRELVRAFPGWFGVAGHAANRTRWTAKTPRA